MNAISSVDQMLSQSCYIWMYANICLHVYLKMRHVSKLMSFSEVPHPKSLDEQYSWLSKKTCVEFPL